MAGGGYGPEAFTPIPEGWDIDPTTGQWTLTGQGAGGSGPGPRTPLDPAAGAGGYGPGPREPLVPPPAAPQTPAVWGTGGSGPGWRTTDVTAPKGPGPAPGPEQGFTPLNEPEERIAPRARGFGGSPAPSLPEEIKPQYGGMYDPADRDTFVSEIETAVLQGKMPRAAGEKAIADYDKRASKSTGIETGLLRSQAETKTRIAGLEHRGAEREATVQEQTAGALEKTYGDIEKSRKQFQADRAEREAQLNVEMGNYRAAIDDLKTRAVDPNRWWRNRSTGEKVGYVLASVLGGMAAGWQGHGNNSALPFLRAAIDDDIAAQRSSIENVKEAGAMSGTLVGRMRERVGDLDQAESAARSFAYEQLAAKIRGIAQREGVAPDARDRAEVMARELEKVPIDEEQKIRLRRAIQFEMQQARAAAASQAKVLKGSQFDERFVASPFGTGFVRDKEQAKDIDAKTAAWRHLDATSAELQALLEKGPSMTGEDKGRAEFLTTEWKFAKKEAAKTGALDAGTQEAFGTQVEDPTAVWKNPETVAGKLRAGRQSAANNMRLQVQSAIQLPAQRGMGREGPVYEYREPKAATAPVQEGPVAR